jgi:L-amino acid N-acyltransferase YncA
MNFSMRRATRADAAAIAAIYAHHVLTGTGTFEIDPPDSFEMAARLAKIEERGWPWLISEDSAGSLNGYAYAGPFRERAAYNTTVEDSIYLAPSAVGQGIGSSLLTELMALCVKNGAKEMLAVIGDSDNQASIGLHKKLGFEDVGIMRRVGVKFGRTLDVVILQKNLIPIFQAK